MTYVKRAQRFARGRRWVTAALLVIVAVTAFAVTAAIGANGKASSVAAPKIANGLLKATVTADSCGYAGSTSTFNAATPYSSYIFNESTVLKGGTVVGVGQAATINAFYSDEHALTLGQGSPSPFTNAYGGSNQQFGDYGTDKNGAPIAGRSPLSIGTATAIDPLHRPIYPAAFVTDLTALGASSKAGDWQSRNSGAAGGTTGAETPDFVGGTWKAFVPNATVADPGSGNTNAQLGPNADPFTTNIPNAGNGEKYNAEIRWNVANLTDQAGGALQNGHKYRVQFIVHDGDQNKTGGDVGEACVVITLPGPPQVVTHPVVGGQQGQAQISEPLGSTINDAATVSDNAGFPNPTGNVTFTLYFRPAGDNTALAQVCDAAHQVAGFTPQTKTLTVNTPNPGAASTAATSPGYDTTGHGFGTYVWRATYDPNGDPNYTASAETCGAETDTMVAARIQLGPHEATNVIGTPHTVTATVSTTTDGTTFTAVSGASVAFTISGSVSGSGPNAHLVYQPTPGTPCTTGAAGTCTTTINDDIVENDTIHASSTFTVSGVQGSFSVSTLPFGGPTCTPDANGNSTCDALKHYINPKTTLHVVDELTGLGSDATGTVTYSAYTSLTDCQGNTNKTDLTPANNNIGAGGAAPLSLSFDVPAGTTAFFTAHYVGNEGTITTVCSAETAQSS